MSTKKTDFERYYQFVTGQKVAARDGSLSTRPTVPCDPVKEDAVLRDCIRWLRSRGIMADRLNNGRFRNQDGAMHQYGILGGGDILVVYRGLHIEIECKRGQGGRWSLNQQKRKAKVEQAEGVYLIVHGVPELESLWNHRVMKRFK